MMEALAIGLAVYGVGATVAMICSQAVAMDWKEKARRYEDHPDYWFERSIETHRELQDLRAQIAAFDHDGNGKIGGSKPRGKG